MWPPPPRLPRPTILFPCMCLFIPARRAASRDCNLIDNDIRNDERANALFMEVLTSPRDPERVLRWMNEATVFGRFIPDFGRVVAQMQFDMYHHYTVDE